MSREFTVLLVVTALFAGLNLPSAFSTVQPKLTKKEKKTVKKLAKKQAKKYVNSKVLPIDTDALEDGAVTADKLADGLISNGTTSISFPIGALTITGTGATNVTTFVSLSTASSGSIRSDFSLPANYKPNTPVVLHFFSTTSEASDCFVVFGASASQRSTTSDGSTLIEFPVGEPAEPDPEWIADRTVKQFFLSIAARPDSTFSAGDSIRFSLTRKGGALNDTCPGDVFVFSIQAVIEVV